MESKREAMPRSATSHGKKLKERTKFSEPHCIWCHSWCEWYHVRIQWFGRCTAKTFRTDCKFQSWLVNYELSLVKHNKMYISLTYSHHGVRNGSNSSLYYDMTFLISVGHKRSLIKVGWIQVSQVRSFVICVNRSLLNLSLSHHGIRQNWLHCVYDRPPRH